MGHTYKFTELSDGSWDIVQHAMQGGFYTRDESYPDVVKALNEDGEPRIHRDYYVAPSVDGMKYEKLERVKSRTQEIFDAGFIQDIDGTPYLFDVGGGPRSLVSWMGYSQACTDVLAGILPLSNLPSAQTKDGQSMNLPAAQGKALYFALLTQYIQNTSTESNLCNQIIASNTVEELNAIIDPR